MFARLSAHIASASSSSKVPPYELQDKAQQVSLAELNNLLDVLAGVFPKHEVALLRNLLLDASQESRLHVAANALIQNPQRYEDKQTRLASGNIADWQKFRSTKYKATVEKLLVVEYQGLAQSTIRNILGENNYDYARSRDELAGIASKSWRYNLAAWISRKKPPLPLPHLDVVKNPTGCVRLDDEIYALRRPERDAQSARDEQLARMHNEQEHAKAHALLECECCFGDFTWEDTTACTEGHFFCRGCLDRSVTEALYGQGSCLRADKASVRCISSAATPACDGFVMSVLLPHFLPPETLVKMEQRFARDQLQSAGLQLVRCPACFYAVVNSASTGRLRLWTLFPLAPIVRSILGILLKYPLGLFTLAFLWLYVFTFCGTRDFRTELRTARACVKDAITRVRRRKTGARQLFKCENPHCGMESCIDCGRPWAAFHDCRREAVDNQRLYVERAMSEAVKRTCPECCTSFVKTEGCNKLTCPCGYEMCYVCRAAVRGVRYWHFCQHFRAVPGTACLECDKCNLYETEDEQAVAAAAARRAAAEWAASRRRGTAVEIEPIMFGANGYWPPWVEQLAERLIELLYEW